MSSPPFYQISSNAPPACYWDIFNRNDITITVDSSGNTYTNPYSETFYYMSYGQQRGYRASQELFRTIYAYNSNAYYNAQSSSRVPKYYTYNSYKEMQDYKIGSALIRQVYPEYFTYIAGVPMKYGRIPFPV
jgi:hypothetical protein